MTEVLSNENILIEGKTKIVYGLPNFECLIVSKDRITAGDGDRAHNLAGKAAISTNTMCRIFEFFNSINISTHFKKRHSDIAFYAHHCAMIPIEFVARRIATGSFLKRHPGVEEGFVFAPPKIETFFKDDANHDPLWSEEQLLSARLTAACVIVDRRLVKLAMRTTRVVFEILERIWSQVDCQLVDLKVEFGIDLVKKQLLLADCIDSDSWRLWPRSDRRLQLDKQLYRDMPLDPSNPANTELVEATLAKLLSNFTWVSTQLDELLSVTREKLSHLVVIVMGSASDEKFSLILKNACLALDLVTELRVCSAHKSTQECLDLVAEYESCRGVRPVIFIAVAGRSNGLGPVLAANTTHPVINCPPGCECAATSAAGEAFWAREDLWSSLRLPSGLGCVTALGAETAALHAAQIVASYDHRVWSRLRARQLTAAVQIQSTDGRLCSSSVTALSL